MVKAVDFAGLQDDQMPYDLVDDLVIFMRNDPKFYRKNYFPTMAKASDMHSKGSNIDPVTLMMPMVDKACNSYCKQYNIPKSPDRLFKAEDRKSACNKVYEEELPFIEKGEYRSK